MGYCFSFRPYRRPFRQPLVTHYGIWSDRQGILLRLSREGRVGWGEIAPLPWFGSESFEQALAYCQQLPPQISIEQIFEIPMTLPACQFGFESAWEALDLNLETTEAAALTMCGLLPAGKAALSTWSGLWKQGYRTLKWKIGVAAVDVELMILQDLVAALPARAKLRLDANAGLGFEEAEVWLQACDALGVEFLEQPLAVEQLDQIQVLGSRFITPIALDESVATLQQLKNCYAQGWRGLVILKPAIAGSPRQLRRFCRQHSLSVIFSSVLETEIGRQSGLRLAAELATPGYAQGFGVGHWFGDDGFNHPVADLEKRWHCL